MDPILQQSLDLNDEACAIIQELVAQLQSKSTSKDLDKKAETSIVNSASRLAAASDMIKKAAEEANPFSFGKVADDVNEPLEKYASAEDKFKAKEAELMAELGLN